MNITIEERRVDRDGLLPALAALLLQRHLREDRRRHRPLAVGAPRPEEDVGVLRGGLQRGVGGGDGGLGVPFLERGPDRLGALRSRGGARRGDGGEEEGEGEEGPAGGTDERHGPFYARGVPGVLARPRALLVRHHPPMAEPTAPLPDDVRLPDNAFRELAPGESFEPVTPAGAQVPEVTPRSIAQGFLWSVVFSAAATYIALKLGQGIESAIPISILAVGASVLFVKVLASRASTLLENVNVLAIGATSGIVAGGSVFTMPAIHILGLEGRRRGCGSCRPRCR